MVSNTFPIDQMSKLRLGDAVFPVQGHAGPRWISWTLNFNLTVSLSHHNERLDCKPARIVYFSLMSDFALSTLHGLQHSHFPDLEAENVFSSF